MRVYYNENDPYTVQWLRNLIDAKLIPGGHIDDRSIEKVRSADLAGFGQAHFFAGIAGWSHALQLAGWPDDREVWTGSCPCQPFSQAGKRRGAEDERHLWPVWRELIRERMPATIFGEQVASKDGRAWLAGVRADLEAMGYAVGAADLCAAGVGAPQIRQRLWWVADAECNSRNAGRVADEPTEGIRAKEARSHVEFGRCGVFDRLADSQDTDGGSAADKEDTRGRAPETRRCGCNNGVGDTNRERQQGEQICICGRGSQQDLSEASGAGRNGRLGNAECNGREQGAKEVRGRESEPAESGKADAGRENQSAWSDGAIYIPCQDGKVRRICSEPGVFPLAHGVPCRVGKLRAYGNAIVPQLAAEFVRACMETGNENL